ncbi:MAG: GTPase Era [Methyloligellaceae bacterium]
MSDMDHILETAPTKCGFVALIGTPNAGKSTLTNQLVGAKVSIVTHKVQTTRARIRAIAMEGDTQIILVDTPGIFTPKRRLDRAMVGAAWDGVKDSDVVALLIDAAKGLDDGSRKILDGLTNVNTPKVLLLNKIDCIEKENLLALTEEINQLATFDKVFMISALNGKGVKDLREYLASTLPFGPWLYPEDQLGDATMRFNAAEITREKLYLRLHEELPYASTIETTQWKTLKDGSVRVEQTIYVERDSQKKIVIGKNGQTIKAISSESRKEISEIAETKIHLFLFVKVRSKWSDDPERYREMGLDFSD